jgi:hypothetical protein
LKKAPADFYPEIMTLRTMSNQILEMAEIGKEIQLHEVQIGREVFYKISHSDRMRPFFMTIVSDSNHWMFVSGNAGISVGRRNSDFALFPYYTDDKITESAENTGCKTLIRAETEGQLYVWEPFSIRSEGLFEFQRNLYKNRIGNKIIFEEINHSIGLSFSYEWNTSNRFGFLRKAKLQNLRAEKVSIEVIDGFQNLLPYGVGADLQNAVSNLADAYKRSELLPESGLGIFTLSAIISDKAEPCEALKANTVWSAGIDSPTYLLSNAQLSKFRNGEKVIQEEDVKGEKGAYLVHFNFEAEAEGEKSWQFVANINQTQSAVIQLDEEIRNHTELIQQVFSDVESGTRNLLALAASADGLQFSADERLDTRHFANVLFNIMRGGVFDENYQVKKSDFSAYLKKANPVVFAENESLLKSLADTLSIFELQEKVSQTGDSYLVRLTTEYLPLKFSRRHGDPSRPWNKFSINTQNEADGSKILDYEGNWRDIFQNWEALAHSYPGFIGGMISKFLNASTFDGYNPYRVTKGGFDWETIEPDNPWSYIGYWGDHQIIYLLKLLEFSHNRNPKNISQWLGREGFVYANVPYQIKPYPEILENPKDTIVFDHKADSHIRRRMEKMGADGALLTNSQGQILEVAFGEKILATVLSKLSNLVPEGGIWMNTQRPEWNDANNALVGNGLSMVTVCYLRRFLAFFLPVLEESENPEIPVSVELKDFFLKVKAVFAQYEKWLGDKISDSNRKAITDALGLAGSDFRTRIYHSKFSGEKSLVSVNDIHNLFGLANAFLEQAIARNRRADGLFHTYNLISIEKDGFTVSHLSEMLEGQVAVLSSGFLSAGECVSVLDALKSSALYRKDQNSYILYPNKNLPRFLQKNTFSKEKACESPLLRKLLESGNRQILESDLKGNLHFNGNFRNASDLEAGLNGLDSAFQDQVSAEKKRVLEIYESVFNHKEFTGRSGTFFGYEGLGSIYWHMVSKLGLAVMETTQKAIENQVDEALIEKLTAHYYAIQDGIGAHKSPKLYGAFPTDPYSHTPLGRGAQQPGMTGQVKEDILCRMAELGVEVRKGKLAFNPGILKKSQFLKAGKTIEFVDVKGKFQTIELPENSLFFTCCQVPVLYVLAEKKGLKIKQYQGLEESAEAFELSDSLSQSVFQRKAEIQWIKVFINPNKLKN